MNPRTQELLFRLEQTDWFHDCGKSTPVGDSILPVASWEEALEICATEEAGEARVESRNELTQFLCRHAPEWPQWNSRARRIRDVLSRLIDRKLSSPAVRARLPATVSPSFREAIGWELQALCMTREYGDLVRPRYVDLVEQVWLAGRFPCGWVGEVPGDMRDAFDKGRLAVL